jgi:rare lipoprotein A
MGKIYRLFLLILMLVLTSCTSFVRFTAEDKIKVEQPKTVIEEINPDIPALGEENFTGEVMTGTASYYADKFHGKKTASGEMFDQEDYTAAHRTLPFGTKVLVTNLENNKSVVVRINDRGPFKKSRLIDVSRAAAEELDMIKTGVVEVEIKVLK